ncbi:MAG TPA: tripartite tricarboxylate transporter substrate binding protein [Micropepsaceae bacterium]|nr:tripartite tricarboxylate transporter substrate binding protein [Micropepsaceae bacterium]
MKTFTRRGLIIGAGLAAPALAMPRLALGAAAYPNKNIQFVIPYAPGGGFDVYVRVIAPVMERYLPNKVNIVPINIASGGGSRGVAQLYRSKPDGYTIGILNIPGMFILQQQQGAGAYDLSKFSWVGAMGEGERYVICVGEKSPLKTFADLKGLAAKRPVKLSVTGPEGTAYAATMIGAQLLGLKTQLITGYKGSADYVVAAIRGDSDAVIAAIPTASRFVKSGTVKVLATFEAHSSFPGVPDATALGQPELDNISVERVVAAPPGLPADIQNTLSVALAKALADPAVVKWAKENDLIMRSRTPQETTQLVAQQRVFFDKWKKYLTAS